MYSRLALVYLESMIRDLQIEYFLQTGLFGTWIHMYSYSMKMCRINICKMEAHMYSYEDGNANLEVGVHS